MSQLKAMIFNIQKFSIHDGPGIRTTVFFKGCPLRCPWCSNPESQSFKPEMSWDSRRCTLCQSCIKAKPEVFYLKAKAIHVKQDLLKINEEEPKYCPHNALTLDGKLKTVDEIMEVVEQDKDFYLDSGGGITLSGGEVLAHGEFIIQLLQEAKRRGIHRAIESTCYSKNSFFKRVLENLDLLIFDLKHYDEQKHDQIIGGSLKQIKENIKTATSSQLPYLCRIPTIPDFNYSLEDAKNLAQLCQELGIKQVELLPFHQFGERKYQLLHRDYAYKNVASLRPEELEEHREIFRQAGIETK